MLDLLPDLPLVSTLDGLAIGVGKSLGALLKGSVSGFGQLYCPKCQRYSRVRAWIFSDRPALGNRFTATGSIAKAIVPSGWTFNCLQCETAFCGMAFDGPNGPELVVFSKISGGLTTPSTSKPVAYYLDQAARADSAGAKSAAIVMFRSALEHLLFEQGYQNGMCGSKLGDLQKDIEAGKAPKWTRDLSLDDLSVLNKLGNAAVHTNGGDIQKQAAFDQGLLIAVSVTFSALLDAVYERPKAEEKRRNRLAAAVAETKK